MEEAAASYRPALGADPNNASVQVSLGTVLRAQRLFDDAAQTYRRALALNPELAHAHNGLGLVLASQQRIGDAVSSFKEALKLDPQLAAAQSNLGAALLRQGRLEEAEQSFHRALELQPNLVVTLLNLGNVLREQGKFDEAEMYLRRGIDLDPKSAEPHNCLGVMLKAANRVDEAIDSYERAIAIDPGNALAHLNLGLARLLNGQLPPGAAHYEWRWKVEECPPLPAITAPAWDGQELSGETLLLRAEQGFGDAIQFIRYAPLVRERCGRLVVQCPGQLLRLFATVVGIDEVVTFDQTPPSVAAHAPLLSLMHLFDTTLEIIPAKVPYLSVDQSWVATFGARIAAGSGLKVGLVWAGATIPHNRSLRLKALTSVLATYGATFFSLQKGEAAAQIADDGFAGRTVDLGPDLQDFADTAAAISCLDLMISVDTAVAHLAGALGKPVWTLIPFAPDWRWLLDRDDSPWYPTMRLYRQAKRGEWGAVIDRVAADLSRHVAIHVGASSQPLLLSSQNTVFAEALDHHRAGRPEQAELLFRQMLADAPGDYRAQYYLGILAARRGDYQTAENLFRSAIAIAPDYADAHYNLGNVLAQLRRFAEATASYREAVLLQPDAVEIRVHLANALHEQGQVEDAIASYRRAIALSPGDAAVHLALGAILQAQGHKEDAIAAYRQALTLNPELADAHNNLGAILALQDQIDNAIECFEEAIRLDPQLASAHANLGTALRRKNRLENAAQSLRRAVELQPDFLGGLITLGNVLRDQGRVDESRDFLERAIELDPTSAESHNCLGLAAQEQNRIAEAVASYEQAIALRPDHAWAHLNLGIARLLEGDLPAGAAHYEWRWQIDECPSLPSLTAPAWDGQPLRDQSLLLRAEQGFGDAIQFIRYAPLVRQRCGHLVLQCPSPLVPLLATAPEVDEVISDQEKPPPIAAHAPLLSLMHLLSTTLETIPAQVPYLGIDPSRVSRFKARLAATAGLRLGLVWAGSPIHKNNRNRSLELAMLASLLATDGVTFYSLQKGEPAAEISANGFASRIVDLGGDLRDFADTAAAISCLDLVISVDTAVAHLAGALARPVWTLVAFVPDWRWLLERENSPWYPTMRLYRQPALGDWQAVIGKVAADLSRHAKQHADAAAARPRGSAKANAAFTAALRHHRAGLEQAETMFRRVLTTDPGHSRALYYLGIIAGRRGEYKAAEDFFRRALALAPHYADAHYNLGNALQEQDRLEDALGSYRRAVMLEPTAAAAHFNLAETLRILGRSNEATASYRRTIALNPGAEEAHLNLGNMLQEQGNPAEAIACFEQVLRLLPGNAAVHYNIANALKLQERFEEAVNSYDRAIRSNPNYGDAYNNLGTVQHELGRIDGAIASFRRSLTLQPDAAPTHKNLGMSLLLKGNLPEGSAEYEWRWQENEFKNMPPVHCPPWDGQPLPDQTILLRTEQGYGDAIQFIRYAPLVRARCGRVVLQCPPQLGELLAATAGIDAVVTKATPVPNAAAHAHLLSLMHILGTTLETLPADIPYLRVDPTRAMRFEERVGATARGLRVGLAWAGNPDHKNDKKRSLPLTAFSPLLAMEGASFFSLQKGEVAAEISAAGFAGRIVNLESALADFADAAAAISCLDLVISVDTAAAHLAGALGKPVWTLIPFAPDWRWLLDRDDSPWYPTMRLYRQPAARDWGSVIASVAEAPARTVRGDGSVSTLPVRAQSRCRATRRQTAGDVRLATVEPHRVGSIWPEPDAELGTAN
jgi:tetratricopeptide (TPR) repeat protein